MRPVPPPAARQYRGDALDREARVGLYQRFNRWLKGNEKPFELAALRSGGCFRSGHLSCLRRRKNADTKGIRSTLKQALDQLECPLPTGFPIAANHFEGLLVLHQPITGGLEEGQALAQFGLAALAVVAPADIFRGE